MVFLAWWVADEAAEEMRWRCSSTASTMMGSGARTGGMDMVLWELGFFSGRLASAFGGVGVGGGVDLFGLGFGDVERKMVGRGVFLEFNGVNVVFFLFFWTDL